ncbi:MAG: glycosyltransferase, partial [Myxococcota bacterium]
MSKVENEVRIDLHVHSSYSDKPFSWFLRSANAAECYTAPDKVYETATRRGMNLITLTDHDTIDGALELRARYDNTFLSEEVSARFPEDGCIVHTIALDITEEQHRELQRLRRNIYELVSYMDQEDIPYFWCHPFSDVNRRLTPSHVERCFLMFRVLELRNGTRDKVHEDRLVSMLEELTPDQLCRWAERYPQTPTINLDAKYALTGGSDDHGGIAIARAYTTFSGEASAAGLRLALRESATTPNGEAGKGTTLAHNCYGVTAGYFASRGQFGTGDDKSKVSLPLLTLLGDRKRRIEQGGGAISRDELSSHGHTSAYQDELYNHVEPALVGGWRSAFEGLLGALGHGRVTEAADGVSDLIKSLLFELPYILAHRWHVRDREVANRLYKSFDFNRPLAKSVRVAILTDTIDDVDGVAIGLRRLHAEARRWGLHLDLVGSSDCERAHYDQDGVFRVPSVFEHRIAEYSQYAWKVPHLPALLRYISDQRIDLIQCSTPGPVGIVGMIAGRLTGVPVIGQFHTDLPEYTLRLTGDPTVAGMMRGFVSWFYRCMDHTLV